MPEKFENGDNNLKTHQMFSVHATWKKCENASIIGQFGVEFEETLDRKIS